jgi:glucose/arabinose dehydrogenase
MRRGILGALVLFGTVLTVEAMVPRAQQTPPAPSPPAAAPAGDARGAAPGTPAGPGRGGGRGNPAAGLYTENCAGCHGIDITGGRAPSLFDAEWLHGGDDETIAKNIHEGFPASGMIPFKDVLTDQQIWQLVGYIRTQAANLKGKPVYVPDPANQIIKSEKQTFKIEVVTKGLETPWGLAFLPDGRLLVTERPGRLRIIENGKLLPEGVKGLPKVWEKQDGGMFDVEVHPQYATNGWIYISYSEILPGWTPPPPPPEGAAPPPPPPGGGRGRGGPPDPPTMTVIMRGKISKDGQWTDQQVLFRAPAEVYSSSNAHYGSRFIFDKDNHLFFTLGEKQQMMDAQDLSKPTGKIHRVNDDGSIPKDNPFVGRSGIIQSIWSYGHRNPQGLAWDPVTGKLWESEHGPQGGDEINVIEPGKNYGWGVITMGVQPGITKRSQEGMEQPIVYWTPSVAPSGIAFYTGDKYPGWKNNLFVTCLAGQQLKRLEISGDKVTHEEIVFNQFGRLHDVIVGPDGYIYTTLQLPGRVLSESTEGMVVRLIPQN